MIISPLIKRPVLLCHYILRSLRRVIKLKSIPSVDGTVQYGEFNGNDFQIKGVQDSRQGGIAYYVCGTGMEPHQFVGGSDLMIGYKFILPFENEIEAELKRELMAGGEYKNTEC